MAGQTLLRGREDISLIVDQQASACLLHTVHKDVSWPLAHSKLCMFACEKQGPHGLDALQRANTNQCEDVNTQT